MSPPRDLPDQDGHAPLHAVLGQATYGLLGGSALERLSRQELVDQIADEVVHTTTLGRSAALAGSRELWLR
jgi:hypothetical protein